MSTLSIPAAIAVKLGTPAAHALAKNAAAFFRGLANLPTLPENVYHVTEDGKVMFRGDVLFALKATHGFPLDFAIDRIINTEGWAIDWVGFIEAARRGDWWDYQTWEALQHALTDADVPHDMKQAIEYRFKLYVVANPHPKAPQ